MLGPGIYSDRMIEHLIAMGAVRLARPLQPGQVQPASLDLRLGERVWRLRASFLPGRRATVAERLADVALHGFSIAEGAVLETGCVYLCELHESLGLPPGTTAVTNPKSSTGRIDVFTRVIADRAPSFDLIPEGYHGPLYAEISPRTFPIMVREGSRLSQIRFRRGLARLDDEEHRVLHRAERLTDDDRASIAGGIAVSVDLSGDLADGLVGYRAKRHTALVDVDRPTAHSVADYWEPLRLEGARSLVLDPGQFYILASKEAVHVPPDHAAEMTPFDPLVGEFRVHYAGFFDPGFGHGAAGGHGSRAVLEVRSYDVPFILEDGQTVGRLVYERMAERPSQLYGRERLSHYQGQGLRLSKHFR